MEIYDEVFIGDVVRLRKVHPCGGYEWEVVRVGADIGMICLTCKRRILQPRRKFARGVKSFLRRGNTPAGSLPYPQADPPEMGG